MLTSGGGLEEGYCWVGRRGAAGDAKGTSTAGDADGGMGVDGAEPMPSSGGVEPRRSGGRSAADMPAPPHEAARSRPRGASGDSSSGWPGGLPK